MPDWFTFRATRRDGDFEDPRREFLVRALTLGAFGLGLASIPGTVRALSGRPRELPPGRSIYRARGEVRVNGARADEDTTVVAGDTLTTGSNSELIFVVGMDAFILRENGRLELDAPAVAARGGVFLAEADSSILTSLRLVTGKLLSVFGQRSAGQRLGVRSPTATVGVRGTGIYIESESERSYVCTCYGATRLAPADEPAIHELITSQHHDEPRYILAAGPAEHRIEPAPVINHTDMELELIEALVGRSPPFAVNGGSVDY